MAPLVRRNDWSTVLAFARAVARNRARAHPDRYTVEVATKKHVGKVFVDTLRNARGATAIASYSTRARPGAPVATPLAWDELDQLEGSDAFDLAAVEARIEGADPWEGFASERQSITKQRWRSAQAG